MERVTNDFIRQRVTRLQEEGMDVGLDGAYGKFAVTTKSGARTLSPRAPNRQVLDWLDAFEEGWRQFQNRLAEYCCEALQSSGDSRAFMEQLARMECPWGEGSDGTTVQD